MKRPSTHLHEIAVKIGLFFLEKNGEDYQKTDKFIRDLSITDIREENGKLVIETARPGLLIGRKAENLNGLISYLNRPIDIVESFSWADYIAPIDWATEIEMEQESEAYASFSEFIKETCAAE